MTRWIAAVICLSLLPATASGQSAPPDFAPTNEWQAAAIAPLRSWGDQLIPVAASLQPAEAVAFEKVEAIAKWNLSGRWPTKDGFSRALTTPIRVSISDAPQDKSPSQSVGLLLDTAGAEWHWVTHVRVAGAHRLRLHLRQLEIPDHAALWVYGNEEAVGPFGSQIASPAGDLWTPSVDGEAITLEVRLPKHSSAARFVISDVLQQFQLDDKGRPVGAISSKDHVESCLIDGKCVNASNLDVIDLYRFAVAHLSFVKGSDSFICTGALLNDTDSATTIPYLLTANHCFDSQATASTLESFWNYFPTTCGGAFPPLGSLPRTLGASLLASGAFGDFTLVRLPSVPAGRVYLGWDASATALSNGASLYRLSHPKGYIQAYSRSKYVASPSLTAPDWDNASFLYATPQEGATFGGSSGGPVILPGGIVVGQLSGVFGPNVQEPCLAGPADYVVDGRLSRSYPSLAAWLNPTSTPPPPGDPAPPSVPGLTSPSLPGFRFWVRISDTRIGTAADTPCPGETVCVAGAIPNRAEVFVRIVGPKPNGYLWPNIIKFNTTKTEVWIQQVSTGATNYYLLPVLAQDSATLPGLVDKTGFLP